LATSSIQNIEEIERRKFDPVVCAAVSVVKREANQNPKEDWVAIQRLLYQLQKHRLISSF
jgi:molecular chaperone GrpE (heat shock protein)